MAIDGAQLLDDFVEGAEIRVLRLQPGDTLVFRYAGRLSEEQYAHLSEVLTEKFRPRFPDVELLIVEDAELAVVRKEGN